jgi:hypothetical protein
MKVLGLVVTVDRIAKDVLVVVCSLVVDVCILSNQVDFVYSDVDADSGLTIPVEVRRLCRVSDVVCRLEVASPMEVLDDDIVGCLYFETMKKSWSSLLVNQ